jgi:purine-nucleoside/S-methyl-5'-thioadenosine phosphorylase / adenosine deaminase
VSPEYLRSTLLDGAGFRHAFFTRRGGRSPAPFDSLDFGGSPGGRDGQIANLNAAARVLAIDVAHL